MSKCSKCGKEDPLVAICQTCEKEYCLKCYGKKGACSASKCINTKRPPLRKMRKKKKNGRKKKVDESQTDLFGG